MSKAAGTQSMNPTRDKREQATERLLATPLSTTILGESLPMDYYAKVGFRFLSLPAWADTSALQLRLQRFRSLYKIDRKRAYAQVIATIRDAQLDEEMVLESVSKLESPRHRFLAELFWPHVTETDFKAVREAGSIASELMFESKPPHARLSADRDLISPTQIPPEDARSKGTSSPFLIKSGKNSLRSAQILHALALSKHCRAIEEELSFLENGAASPQGEWMEAISMWQDVCGSDPFWEYLALRVKKLDDPRMQPEDVRRARAEIPRIILGINELFAERYSAAGRLEECARHLNVILNSGFSKEIVDEASVSAIRKIAGRRLEQLLKRAQHEVETMQSKRSRSEFEKSAGPLLEEGREIQGFLSRQLKIPNELLSQSAFDSLAETLLKGLNTKLSYDGEQRERNFVYASVFCRRLMLLPLSGGVRRRIEQSLKDNGRYLYARYGLDAAQCPDPSMCFMLEGVEADPDASQIVRLYRITDRQINLNRQTGGLSVSVSYESGRLIVPCSQKAASAKHGKVELDIPESQYTPAQREVARQLNQLESDYNRLLAHHEMQRNAALNHDDVRTSREVAEAERASDRKIAKARKKIEQEQAEEKQQLQAETARLEQELKQVQAAHSGKLKAARAKADRLKGRIAGFKGYLIMELPGYVILAISLRLMGLRELFWEQIVVPAGIAIFAGRYARLLVAAVARRTIQKAEKAYATERKACEQKSKKRAAEIQKASKKRREPDEKLVAKAEQAVEEVRKAGAHRREQTLAEWKSKIEQAKEEWAMNADHLRAKLRRSVEVKSFSSRKKEFPPYRAAKQSGYKEGSKPSSREMQVTDSERAAAQLRFLIGR